MEPATKKRLAIASAVFFGMVVVGTLAGVLTAWAIRKQYAIVEKPAASGEAALAVPAPLASAAAVAAPVPLALPADPFPGTSDAASSQEDPKAAWYAESQKPIENLYMALGPDALLVAAQSGPMFFPFSGLGPCRSLRSVSNVSLDLSAAATGCRGLQCAITLRVTMPAPNSCADIPGPYPTVYIISGFNCSPTFYSAAADHFASWGYAAIQYERPGWGPLTPASETETAYFPQILSWRNLVNNTNTSFVGQFGAGPVAVVGHSMGGGLASILAGSYPTLVGATALWDPVDYTHLSLRVARQFLATYKQPALVVTVGVHCLDLNGCIPPQDHRPSDAEEAAWQAQGLCQPSWSCCNWDDNRPGMETKSRLGISQATDGPSGFVEFSADGSWLARFGLAGHMSLTAPGSNAPGFSCPAVEDSSAVQPDAIALTAAFLDLQLRGAAAAEAMALGWAAAKPAQHLTLGLKGQQSPAVASV